MAKIQDVLYTFQNMGADTSVYNSQLPGGENKAVKKGKTVTVDFSTAKNLNTSKIWELIEAGLPKQEAPKKKDKQEAPKK